MVNNETFETKLSYIHMYSLIWEEKVSSKFISFHNMDANQCLKHHPGFKGTEIKSSAFIWEQSHCKYGILYC